MKTGEYIRIVHSIACTVNSKRDFDCAQYSAEYAERLRQMSRLCITCGRPTTSGPQVVRSRSTRAHFLWATCSIRVHYWQVHRWNRKISFVETALSPYFPLRVCPLCLSLFSLETSQGKLRKQSCLRRQLCLYLSLYLSAIYLRLCLSLCLALYLFQWHNCPTCWK